MKKLNFENVADLSDRIVAEYEDRVDSLDFSGIGVVAHYPVMMDLLNCLVKNTDFKMYDISLCPSEIDNYSDEYILGIDVDGFLWLQRAKYDTDYVFEENDVTFVHGDVNSAFVVKNKGEYMIEFEIDEEDNEDFEKADLDTTCSENVHVSRDGNGRVLGFSKSWSSCDDGFTTYSSYSHYSDDFDAMKIIAEDFGVKL